MRERNIEEDVVDAAIELLKRPEHRRGPYVISDDELLQAMRKVARKNRPTRTPKRAVK